MFEGDETSLPKDKKQKEAKLAESLSKAASAITDLAKEAADVKTETLDIDQVRLVSLRQERWYRIRVLIPFASSEMAQAHNRTGRQCSPSASRGGPARYGHRGQQGFFGSSGRRRGPWP